MIDLARPYKLSEVKEPKSEDVSAQSLLGHLFCLSGSLRGSTREEIVRSVRALAPQIAKLVEADAILVVLNTRGPGEEMKISSSFGMTLAEEKALVVFVKEAMVEAQGSFSPIHFTDFRARHSQAQSFGQRSKLVSLFALPLCFDGLNTGFLVAARGEVGGFYQNDRELLHKIADFVAEDHERNLRFIDVVRDPLTGFYHRQMLAELVSHEVARSRRYQAPLSAIMIDVDGFAQVRAQLSTPDTNKLISKIARRIASEIRQTDLAARISDNAFMLVHPMTHTDNAGELAQRLRLKFNQDPIALNEIPLQIGLSIGISSLHNDDDEPFSFMYRADQALLAAKRMGGNHIMVHDGLGL